MKQKGDYVNEDDVIAEVETDKTSIEVRALHSGTIVELLIPDGEKVTPKQKLYKIEVGVGAAAPATEKAEAEKQHPEPPVSGDDAKSEQKLSEHSEVPPTPSTSSSETVETSRSVEKQAISGERCETRVKMNRLRLRIAQRLKDAQNTYAMLTTFNEIDVSNVIEMRKRYQKMFLAKHGVKLGFMSPFIKSVAFALQQRPIVNAVIDGGEIVYRHYVDISIAVATPKGLVVPVLRNVDRMDYGMIEQALTELGNKARDGKLAIEDMEGGTFTISNGGVFGSLFGTPIINPPQSAILGMHAIFDRPVAVDGKVEIRPMMTVALTYDHRLIDGREAVSFLKTIKTAVEDPRVILMNV
uniref:Dihydrolipoyllysine-residue succinyltransferase component of 2-oxoglutarate dehydrogenase complex, mitochondrial n=1 Tax=Syphacia muris TaxID=451379 RepID=A0A0N5AJB7_9BILA